ncbi:hypothetical protein DdX_04678 [Ditylenchus destructor]|uniref:Gag protein n=1 Tax=Ditylenchus destructor TaxID=166010 RepID=A0AAD4RA05_9BILA|nr:hypothetical protein DdX_04678 [Ditylenchus destructor]
MASAFIRSSIEVAFEDALPYLDNQIDFTVPDPPPSVEDCKKKVKELNRLLHDIEPLVSQLDNGYANWNALRGVISVAEREADKFLADYDFMRTLANLKKYAKKIFRAREDFSELIPAVAGPAPTPVTASVPAAPPVPSSQPEDVILRPLEIPKFYGDLHEWPAWWECFEYAVHKTSKAKAYKLILLKSALGGEAKSAVAQVSGDGAGYDDAIKILKDEFGNERAIKKNLYYKLQTIRPAQDHRLDLRRFIDEVDQICSSLERMGEDVNSLSFVTGLQDRLPRHIRRKLISEEKSLPPGTDWTTARLRKKIREIVRDEDEIERSMARMTLGPEREASRESRDRPRENFREHRNRSESPFRGPRNSFKSSMSPARGEYSSRHNFSRGEYKNESRSEPGPTMGFLGSETPEKAQSKLPQNGRQSPHFLSSKTRSESVSPNRQSNCFFCGLHTHRTDFCPFKYVDRKACIVQRKLCFKCLKENHFQSQCEAKCEKCGSRHHKWLCPSNWHKNFGRKLNCCSLSSSK